MRFTKLLGVLVVALACTTPVLAQSGYPGARLAASDLRDDGRRVWMAADGGGRFVYLGRGRWLEVDARGRAPFDELRRTPDYVELHNDRQRVNVILFDTGAYELPAFARQWRPLAEGGWK